jgi:hypothetical protein
MIDKCAGEKIVKTGSIQSMDFKFVCLLLVLFSYGNAQRYMPFEDRYAQLRPNPMPQFRQAANIYQRFTGNQPQITDDGVKVNNGMNTFWLLCQSANCGRG